MSRRLRILLVPFGSEGDVNPLVWFARGLRDRGHEPVFLITPHYRERVEEFEWHPIGTEEDFFRMAGDPNLWKPFRGTFRVADAMFESLDVYRKAFAKLDGRFDLVVTTSFSFAAASLAEAAKIPHLMLHLQPVCMRSAGDPPLMGAGLEMFLRLPRPALHAMFAGADVVLNRILLPRINAFRAELGLPAWRHFYREALMSGDAVGLLFPDWFAPPQPGWPTKCVQFGFPIEPGPPPALPEALRAWIKNGPAPVVWTHGSANLHTEEFFRVACGTSVVLKIRSLLVGRQAPEGPLPEGVFHWPHVAFESLFSHATAVVHHGGIGTTAKAFAAALPQVVIPLAHDQFDNAARVERLGAGLRSRANPLAATAALHRVLESPGFRASSEAWKKAGANGDRTRDQAGLLAESLAARKK